MPEKNNQIIIYSTEGGEIKLEVKLENETVWLSQKQMAELFQKNVPTINEHIKNVFFEGELEENRTIRKFRIVQMEGEREITREIESYDVIISINPEQCCSTGKRPAEFHYKFSGKSSQGPRLRVEDKFF